MTFPSVTNTNTSGSRISENGFYLNQALRHNSGEDKPESEYTTGPRFSRSGEPYVNASESLQALLHLNDPRVLLNQTDHSETFQPAPTTTAPLYNENIPVEHRIYLEATREELLKQYVRFIKGFKTAVFPLDRMTPYDRTSRDILYALNLTPGREKDAQFLHSAFAKLHDFFLEYNHAMQEAVASHPHLKSLLRKVGAASVKRVIALVLEGKEIEHEPLESAPMIVAAQAAAKITAQERSQHDNRVFYSRRDCVVGASLNAPLWEINELAAGRVGYHDLASLLRYGPTGEIHTTIAHSRGTDKTAGGYGRWVDVKHSVTYKNTMIRHLYYRKNPDTPDEEKITVLLGKDGFLPKGTLVPLPFTNPPSDLVRQYNDDILGALILNARQRLNR
jgi:hypothetical protein